MAAFQSAAQIDCVFQTIRTVGEPLRTALYRCVPAYFTPMSPPVWLYMALLWQRWNQRQLRTRTSMKGSTVPRSSDQWISRRAVPVGPARLIELVVSTAYIHAI